MHAAVGRALRVLEIDDCRVVRIRRVERELHSADELLVRAGCSERLSVENGCACRYLYVNDLGAAVYGDEETES
jgi:hypothetical protein